MRNAAIASTATFLLLWWPLTAWGGSRGLWVAFILYVCARAGALLFYYPGLRRSVAAAR